MSTDEDRPVRKPLKWVGDSREELRGFPDKVRLKMGHALHLVQIKTTPTNAKPLSGFGGAGVLEIVENDVGGTYRAVYTVKFREAVYVLHAFQKKSKSGIKTPKPDVKLIKDRLKAAAEMHLSYLEVERHERQDPGS